MGSGIKYEHYVDCSCIGHCYPDYGTRSNNHIWRINGKCWIGGISTEHLRDIMRVVMQIPEGGANNMER
jgi:hypothetical protein